MIFSLPECQPFQIVKIYLTYDKINFFGYAVHCFSYENIEVENYFPTVIHNLKTQTIYYTLKISLLLFFLILIVKFQI